MDKVGTGTEVMGTVLGWRQIVGMGWGWIQCARGRAGMGFSFYPRTDL